MLPVADSFDWLHHVQKRACPATVRAPAARAACNLPLAASRGHRLQVRIFDTTLRDGEQSPGATLTSKEKLEIAKKLSQLGEEAPPQAAHALTLKPSSEACGCGRAAGLGESGRTVWRCRQRRAASMPPYCGSHRVPAAGRTGNLPCSPDRRHAAILAADLQPQLPDRRLRTSLWAASTESHSRTAGLSPPRCPP